MFKTDFLVFYHEKMNFHCAVIKNKFWIKTNQTKSENSSQLWKKDTKDMVCFDKTVDYIPHHVKKNL